MTQDLDPVRTALAPLRAALSAEAREQAARRRADASAEAERMLAAARAQGDAVLAEARSRGRAQAAAALQLAAARDRRAARECLLRARQEVVEQLREQIRLAVRAALDEPGTADRLGRFVRDALGPDAVVRDLPGGGVIGRTPDGRELDVGVDALVDAALAELDIEQLWAPD